MEEIWKDIEGYLEKHNQEIQCINNTHKAEMKILQDKIINLESIIEDKNNTIKELSKSTEDQIAELKKTIEDAEAKMRELTGVKKSIFNRIFKRK